MGALEGGRWSAEDAERRMYAADTNCYELPPMVLKRDCRCTELEFDS